MRTYGKYPSIVNENYLVHAFYRCDSVSNENSGLAGTVLAKIPKDDFLGVRINCGNGVIHYENRRILHKRACYGNTLLLSAGYGHTAFAENGILTLFELHDVAVNIGKHSRIFDGCFVSIVKGKADISCNGIGE